MTSRAQEIINKELRDKTGILELHNCGLTTWPEEIFEMEWLEILNISISKVWNRNSNNFISYPEFLLKDGLKNELNSMPDFRKLKSLKVLCLSGALNFGNFTWGCEYTNLEILHLSNCKISKMENISIHRNLKYLDLSFNNISELNDIRCLTNLEYLNLNNNVFNNLNNFNDLNSLKYLSLQSNCIKRIGNLENLHSLQTLNLSMNFICDIENLDSLVNLEILNLEGNEISEIKNLENLLKINKLGLNRCGIRKIENIKHLVNLQSLDLSFNKIVNLDNLIENNNLNYLNLYGNPIESKYGLVLNFGENHWVFLKNYFLRQNEENKVKIFLPVKILLLGNHGTGKSSLLHYLQNDNLAYEGPSTHVLKIEYYKKDETNYNLPNAIIFDFGGQDYYHGIYKSFLSQDALYVLMWQKSTDKNEIVAVENNKLTVNYDRKYWLGQKKYLENEIYCIEEKPDPLILIQSHLDQDEKEVTNSYEARTYGIHECFNVSLLYNNIVSFNDLELLKIKGTIQELINRTTKKIEEPSWYIDFLNYIMNDEHDHKPVLFFDLLPYFKLPIASDVEKVESMHHTLIQLHRAGFVLYYPDVFTNLVWLKPSSFLKHAYGKIFSSDFDIKQIIEKKSENDKIQFIDNEIDINFNHDYISLLIFLYQKICFINKDKLIFPNLLKLSKEDPDYSIHVHGKIHLFTLRFETYLPFGYLNFLICFFNNEAESITNPYRDSFVMIFFKIKLLVELNLEELEVKFFHFDINNNFKVSKLESYLFYTALCLYWDLEVLSYREYLNYFNDIIQKENYKPDDGICERLQNYDLLYSQETCFPDDLYVSLDELNFVSYKHYYNYKTEASFPSYIIGQGTLDIGKILKATPFKILFENKFDKFNHTFKIAISYAKEDNSEIYKYNPVKELYDNLSILKRDRPIEIFIDWNINENNWDRQIREKFNEADLIIVMNSPFYNKTEKRYIWEVEMPIIQDKWKEGNLSVIRVNISDCACGEDVEILNDFKKGFIPLVKQDRDAYFKDFIKDLIIGKVINR